MTTDFDTILPGIRSLGRISLLDKDRGWITAWTGNMTWILRTQDGGSTWEKFPITVFDVSLCSFVDPTRGWVAGASSFIYRTTDSGSTWDSTHVNAYELKMDLQFIDTSRGWVANDGPTISTGVLGSSDGGGNWNLLTEFLCSALSTYLYFTDTSNGWVVQYTCFDGGYAEILHTTDGGWTWATQYKYYPISYYVPHRVFFLDPLHGWIVGEGGTILHTTNGGITSVSPDNSNLIGPFLLSQNYPNPFNPVTTISYTLPKASHVRLKIYNVLGEEVASLVDEFKQPGTFSADFDGANFSSGMYFYRLTAGEFTEVKKMMLVK
jgi:photosystem II stability/assembly factor-like uncharacterized protein